MTDSEVPEMTWCPPGRERLRNNGNSDELDELHPTHSSEWTDFILTTSKTSQTLDYRKNSSISFFFQRPNESLQAVIDKSTAVLLLTLEGSVYQEAVA